MILPIFDGFNKLAFSLFLTHYILSPFSGLCTVHPTCLECNPSLSLPQRISQDSDKARFYMKPFMIPLNYWYSFTLITLYLFCIYLFCIYLYINLFSFPTIQCCLRAEIVSFLSVYLQLLVYNRYLINAYKLTDWWRHIQCIHIYHTFFMYYQLWRNLLS